MIDLHIKKVTTTIINLLTTKSEWMSIPVHPEYLLARDSRTVMPAREPVTQKWLDFGLKCTILYRKRKFIWYYTQRQCSMSVVEMSVVDMSMVAVQSSWQYSFIIMQVIRHSLF